MNYLNKTSSFRTAVIPVAALIALFAFVSLSGCNTISGETSKEQTRIAISLQQTELAEKSPADGELSSQDRQATRAAQSQLGGQDSSVESKQVPIETPEQGAPSETATPEATLTLEPTQGLDFDAWKETAKILLFEDMIANTDTPRYVKEALDQMGLSYKDDGSAKGWLREDILGGPPGGGAWDLVILAAEAKSGVQGEFFQYVLDAIDQGSSVIMEVWYLDETYNGTASALLGRCGVEFQNNWEKVPPNAMVMFPLDSTHPILHEPNSLSFTKTTDYWWDPDGDVIYDIGDRVQLGSSGDAQILVGTHPTYTSSHGTVTVCIEDRLILQTFSSHQLHMDSMVPIWENYIHHALKTRYENLE